jgi:hypothetical protein
VAILDEEMAIVPFGSMIFNCGRHSLRSLRKCAQIVPRRQLSYLQDFKMPAAWASASPLIAGSEQIDNLHPNHVDV